MKHFYIKICLFSILLTFAFVEVSGQTTIWSEDFSSNNGNSLESGRWSTNGYVGDDWFKVKNEKLEIRDNNKSVAEWLTSSISISGYSNVSISINAQESGTLEPQGNGDEDYILFQYRIDGGAWQDFFDAWYDDFPNNNTDRNASITGLSGSTLQIRVQFKNGTGNAEYYRIDDVEVAGDVISLSYCSTQGTCLTYYYMGNVQIGSIDNSSTCEGYRDFTSISTDVNIGSDYTINLQSYNPYNYRVYYCIWVDWNQDGDFNDSNEETAITGNNSIASATVSVPSGAQSGVTRMRVKMMYVYNTDPCQSGKYYGEIEDYSLNVIASGASPVAICKNYTVNLNASGNASITPANINNGSSDVETSTANLILSLDKSTFDCSNLGANTVTLTVEDEAGNKSTCSSTVTVVDNLNPTALCKNKTIKLDASGNASITTADIDNGSSDNCGIDTQSLSKSSFTNADIGAIAVVLTVTDASGHSSSCNAMVTVQPADPSVTLSVGSNSIDENGGGTRITATIPSVYTDDITVNLNYSGGSSSNYSAANQIVIPAGSTSAYTNFTAVDNDIYDGDKDVTIEISSVINGVKNGAQQQIITIVDNDAPSTASIEIDEKSPENTYTADELVQDVMVTGCLVASNITFEGDETNGLGYFNQGDSDFPLPSGVIMSTGAVGNAEGPARNFMSDTNDGFDFDEDNQDSDLVTLTGAEYVYTKWWGGHGYYWGYGWDKAYYDAQILEFDFVPAGDQLEFNYIFASEEYNGYACSDYNDGFAFILSGPGITNDTGLSGQNIALTENGDQVSINNVYENQCSGYSDNSEFYVDEIGGYSISFDGRTSVLTASAEVQACETYHIKLVIYDRNDHSYNSAVFIEANSFKSNEVEVDNMIGTVEGNQDVMYEGCDGSFMRFNRAADYDINEEIEFSMNIAGTASNEAGSSQDYIYVDADGDMIGDGVFPTTITIPSGAEYADYYYEAVSDDEVENDETIIFRIDRCPCEASEYYEKTVTIINSPKVDAVASAAIKCEGAGNPTATITIQLVDGVSSANYLFSFDGGTNFDIENAYSITSAYADGRDLVGTTFDIVVKDLFSCSNNTLTMQTTIPAIESISADAGGNRSVCAGNEIQLIGSGGIYYEWSCSTPGVVENYLSNPNVRNPTVSASIPVGEYEFTLLVQDQEGSSPVCSDQESMILKVLKTPSIGLVYADEYELCSGEQTSFYADVDMVVSYLWNPPTDLDNKNSATPVFSADVLSKESRSYTLTVKASNGCTAVQSLDKAITVYPNPSISLIDASSNLCTTGTDGEIHVEAIGGTLDASSSYDYEWSHNSSINSSISTGLAADDYTVTVTDSKACSDTKTFRVTAQPKPIGIFFE